MTLVAVNAKNRGALDQRYSMIESDPLSHMYSGDSDPLCVRLLLWSRVSSALEGDLLAPFRPFPPLKSMPPPGTAVHLRLKESYTVKT